MPYAPIPLDGGQCPVQSTDDVLKAFPKEYQTPEAAPIRDAIVAAIAEAQFEYQRRATYAAAQSDPLRATDYYLTGLADDHDVVRQPGQLDADLRPSIFATPDVVTPDAILAAVNLIIGDTTSQLIDSELDSLYITDGSAAYDAFIGVSPYYPDRLYPDDGGTIPQNDPGAAWVMSDSFGRYFILRIRPMEDNNDEFTYIINPTTYLSDETMAWIADGSDTSGAESDGSVATSIFEDPRTSEEIYSTIIGTVERLKGQGIRWMLYVDPAL